MLFIYSYVLFIYGYGWKRGLWFDWDKIYFVDNFGEFTPPKVEFKLNIDEAFVHIEASYVDFGVKTILRKTLQ